CFKPVRGNGSRGFGVIVHDIERGNFLGTKAGILPLTLSEWTLRMPKQFDIPLMVCAYLSGIEYSVDMLCSSGKTLFCVPRTRDKMIGGISVAGKLDRNFGLIAFCIQLAQAMELDGPIGMQWREDSEGVPHLIEINPRLQGTTSVLALAGINFPVQAVRLALGMELTSNTADIDWGSRFVRFWDERMLS
ncbi:MAG: ATP-grasp domain-containing protein, partial [Bacteroidetes bacterium]|nr:ATP-grasp domain-containing protein [Bacteroidota bacterium]